MPEWFDRQPSIDLSLLPAPQPGPQAEFAGTDGIDIVIYGGGAGGGKTFGLLLYPAWRRHVDNPGFDAVFFRRTSPMITNVGCVWDDSMSLYPLAGAEPRLGDTKWIFKSGAQISFRHLQHADTVLDWQSSQVCGLLFDELTHFEESQFFYMLSRNRSTCGIKPYVRAGCNPEPGWVKRLIAPWVDRDFENRAEPGEERWFARIENEIVWVDEDWRYESGDKPKSITFIPSSVYDNPKLLEVNPEYVANLLSLPTVERERLLRGDWSVASGSFFDDFRRSGPGSHVITPQYTPDNPPPHWYVFRGGLDWGYDDPFAFAITARDGNQHAHILESYEESRLDNASQADKVCAALARWGIPKQKFLLVCDATMWYSKTINGVSFPPDIEDFIKAGLICAPAPHGEQANRNRNRQIRADLKYNRLKVYAGYNARLVECLENAKHDPRPEKKEQVKHDGSSHLIVALGNAIAPYATGATDPGDPYLEKEPDHRPAWMRKKKAGKHVL